MATSKISKDVREIQSIRRNLVIPANSKSVGYADHAQVPAGYTFLCWTTAISDGWMGLVYPSYPNQATTNFWTTEDSASERNVQAVFLCYK